MKASNAGSATALVSAIQISCTARLAFGYWLFGSLASLRDLHILRMSAQSSTWRRCSPSRRLSQMKPRIGAEVDRPPDGLEAPRQFECNNPYADA
jgi:hypothetical protein